MLKDWNQIEQKFAEMIAENGWHQQPMIEFIGWVRESEWAERLAVRTSHGAVRVCFAGRSDQDEHVIFEYRQHDQRFGVAWYRGGGTIPKKELFCSPTSSVLWNRVLQWLGLEYADQPT